MRQKLTLILLLLAVVAPVWLNAQQVGGTATYKFMTLTNSARVAALGGEVITPRENDLNICFHNPATLSPTMDNHLVLNYVRYFADINYGYMSYAKDIKKIGTFAAGIHYVNYGSFTEADELGNRYGEFKAAEYAINIMWSRPIDSLFTAGINLKPVISNLEKYNSYGIAADIGISYHNPSNRFNAAFVLKNIGSQIKPYHHDNYEPLPFDMQLSVSQKLAHAPFRFTLLLHHLHRWDLTYNNPENPDKEIDPFTGEVIEESAFDKYSDMVLRHAIFGAEILITDNFHIDFGYNHQRRKELQISTKPYLVGFSWGFGFKISKFHISYGRATYHLAGASNHFSFSTNFSEFYQKKHDTPSN